jgi:hypothetical protein
VPRLHDIGGGLIGNAGELAGVIRESAQATEEQQGAGFDGACAWAGGCWSEGDGTGLSFHGDSPLVGVQRKTALIRRDERRGFDQAADAARTIQGFREIQNKNRRAAGSSLHGLVFTASGHQSQSTERNRSA